MSYGADPLLGTYAGQTPEELAEGPAAKLLRLHIADVQGRAVEPWRFPPPGEIIGKLGLLIMNMNVFKYEVKRSFVNILILKTNMNVFKYEVKRSFVNMLIFKTS